MKIAIIGDLHIGVRNDNQFFMNKQIEYLNKFMDTLKERKIRNIIILGDITDRRKFTNHITLWNFKKKVFDRMDKEFEVVCLKGNHDLPYKDTYEGNTLELFFKDYENFYIVKDIVETDIDNGKRCLFVNWMLPNNEKEFKEKIKYSNVDYCFGHFELKDFYMTKEMKNETGLDGNLFEHFKYVFSGHYHNYQRQGNIIYVGSPYQMTWNDYNIDKGFMILDTKTDELEFIKNKDVIFERIDINPKDMENFNFKQIENKIVRLYIKEFNDLDFEVMQKKLEKVNINSLEIIDTDELIKEEIEDVNVENVLELTKQFLKENVKGEEQKIVLKTFYKIFEEAKRKLNREE